MTRKRYVKLLMAAGADRNAANTQARLNRECNYAYSDTVEEDTKKYSVLSVFFTAKAIPVTIRPRKMRKNVDGLRAQWAFVDETPLLPACIRARVEEEIKKKPPHLEMTAAVNTDGRIKRIIEVSLVPHGGYPLGGACNE